MPAWLKVTLIVIQIVDIMIHVSINEVEPIRILSNLIIIGWVVTFWFARDWIQARKRPVSFSAIGLYLLLSLIFLAQNGLTNPNQDGNLRTGLLVFVISTCMLSIYGALSDRFSSQS